MCVCEHAPHVYVWRPEVDVRCQPVSFHFIFGDCFSPNLELAGSKRGCLASDPQRSTLLGLPSTRVIGAIGFPFHTNAGENSGPVNALSRFLSL